MERRKHEKLYFYWRNFSYCNAKYKGWEFWRRCVVVVVVIRQPPVRIKMSSEVWSMLKKNHGIHFASGFRDSRSGVGQGWTPTKRTNCHRIYGLRRRTADITVINKVYICVERLWPLWVGPAKKILISSLSQLTSS